MSESTDFQTQPATPHDAQPGKAAVSASVHQILAALPPQRFPVSRRDVPPDGIYLLYETGETALVDGEELDRVVGVGTHTGEGRLARRLGIHASGDRRGSDLRLYLGSAVLAQQNPADPRLQTWLNDKRTPMDEIEGAVSEIIRDRFTVRCIPVPDREERQSLEQALLPLLARNSVAPPSEEWLGRHAAHREIRASGMWNPQHGNAPQLRAAQIARITELVAGASA